MPSVEHVGKVEVGEDGHRHDWVLWNRQRVARSLTPVFHGYVETWYCSACRLVDERRVEDR